MQIRIICPQRDGNKILMENLSYIVSQPFAQACRQVAQAGYSLHVIGVKGSELRMSAELYSPNVQGVEIADTHFDFETRTPSAQAIVYSIVNVGGLWGTTLL